MTDYAFMATSPVTVSHDDLYAGRRGPRPPRPRRPTRRRLDRPPTTAAIAARRSTAPADSWPGHQPRVRRGRDRHATRCRPARSSFLPPATTAMPAPRLAPLRTVMAAVPKIPSSGAGTIVLRGGIYHQSVKVESNRSATIQNYPGEAVWFDGSVPVTNWAASGTHLGRHRLDDRVQQRDGWRRRLQEPVHGHQQDGRGS